ncbi:hypothetical protein L2E82_06525 [Cichorium intybus]|uniref:Uncharacterized protein n=1 Tax=Cichorium intybus TaxID=13427 RepID=A0ACB9H9T5_CICIN|nr:hypothetical protein L2E82_06525 [Cichorium intybus]
MEISFTFSDYGYFKFLHIFLALMFRLFCYLLFLFPFIILAFSQSNKRKACKCVCCNCNGTGPRSDLMAVTGSAMVRMTNGGGEMMAVERERQQTVGASMMEQLVPEITTHVLSYLDYRSLCSLSMTNSSMRRAANEDNAWKTLYHKDFTTEQDGIRPGNGWKAYYAATKAIVNINQRFFDIIRERSIIEMGQLWLNADYVKCVHASGDIFTGYNRVIRSWQVAFNWELGIDFQIQDVSARVMTDTAWVTMKAYIAMDHSGLNLTNVFEFHNGRWFLVHHHSSEMVFNDGELPPLLG